MEEKVIVHELGKNQPLWDVFTLRAVNYKANRF
nr:MAG TPA: hypothetical protein [Caudoviricetes sp.]